MKSGDSADVFDFRVEIARSKRKRRIIVLKLVAAGLTTGAALGWASIAFPDLLDKSSLDRERPHFAVCGIVRQTCVIDGDTFWFDGDKIRIADIDTPELKGRCEWEIDKAIEARDRLVVLLNEGPFELQSIGTRDLDRYGRKLRVVTRRGASLGDRLVSEGLARTWTGRRETWC